MQKTQGSALPHILEWMLLGLVFVYLVSFVFANSEQTVALRFWTHAPMHELKAAFPILASFFAGFAVATFAASLVSLDRVIELRRVRKRMRALQEEVARLRIGAEPVALPARTDKAASALADKTPAAPVR